MSSRFAREDRDPRDSRYPPRDRSPPPPPPRFPDRRPSYASRENSWTSNQHPPNRPGYAPRFEGRPSGPPSRGRGFTPRSEFRDFRDGRTSPIDRQSDRWRDGEPDRWERRRSRTPPREPLRDRGESRDSGPRDIDTDRARRHSRDGPLSAGTSLSDAGRMPPSSHRGGFGRGSGPSKSEWEMRNRGRPHGLEERDALRSRSRSRELRRDRDRSTDSHEQLRRDDVRRDDLRERRDDDRRPFRDRDVRDGPAFKREPPVRNDYRPAADVRHSGPVSPGPSNNDRPRPQQPPAERTGGHEFKKDVETSSRGQGSMDSSYSKDARGERGDLFTNRTDAPKDEARGTKPDLLAGRAESSRYAPRTSSPPPAVTQVPAFGTPWFQQPYRSNVWRNPATTTNKPTAPGAVSAPDVSPSKVPPVAPRAQLGSAVPVAPKAERLVEKSSTESLVAQDKVAAAVEVAPAPTRASQQPPSATSKPEGPLASDNANVALSKPAEPAKRAFSQPQVSPQIPPVAPRAMTVSHQSFKMSPPLGSSVRDPSPASGNIPLGPRVLVGVNTSPKAGNILGGIPTGPKAERVNMNPRAPPIAPRADLARQQPPAQWRPPTQPSAIRSNVVPSKRDIHTATVEQDRPRGLGLLNSTEALGDPVHKAPRLAYTQSPRSSAAELPRASSDTGKSFVEVKPEPSNIEKQDVVMAEGPPVPEVDSVQSPRPSPDAVAKISSDDDDGMEFEEEDFAEHEARFERERNRLQSKKVDLSSLACRSIVPLERISELVGILRVVPSIDFQSLATKSTEQHLTQKHTLEHAPTKNGVFVSARVRSASQSPDRASSSESSEVSHADRGPPTPLSDPEQYFGDRYERLTLLLKADFEARHQRDLDVQQDLEAQYAELYVPWRRETRTLSPPIDEYFTEMPPPASPKLEPLAIAGEMPAPLPPTPGEGRRAHRFSSQYDIERILELSKREHQEAQEKQAEAGTNSDVYPDKEADVPDMLTPEDVERRRYVDTNQLRRARNALKTYEFAPQVDAFTEEEDRLLRELYNQHTKAWGRIASLMREKLESNRSYKECINHYYATKWDKPYKKPQGRKGKGVRTRKAAAPRRGLALYSNGDGDSDKAGKGGESGSGQVSETGRPRRAAAPKHFGDKEAEAAQANAAALAKTSATSAPLLPGGEPATDKTGRRKVNKDKAGVRKPRNLAARQLAGSPVKEVKPPEKEGFDAFEGWPPGAALPTARDGKMMIPMPQPQVVEVKNGIQEPVDVPPVHANQVAVMERPRAISNQRNGPSSYWAVTEEELFRQCLAYFGTDFVLTAQHMGSKSQTMIKNRFEKYVQTGQHPDVVNAAHEADARRARGEDMGPPPDASGPLQNQRRGRQLPTTTQTNLPRTLAPNPDVVEGEGLSIPRTQAPSYQPSPPRIDGHPKVPAKPLPFQSPAMSAAPAPRPSSSHQSPPTTEPLASGSHMSQHRGAPPRLGFFYPDAPRLEPSRISNVVSAAREMEMSQPGRSVTQAMPVLDRIKSEHNPNLRQAIARQPEPISYQGQQSAARDDPYQQSRPPTTYGEPATQAMSQSRSRNPSGAQELSSALRHLSGQFQSSVSGLSNLVPASHVSAVHELPQQMSRIQVQSPAPQPRAHPVPLQPARPEPPRRSNIMSLLNSTTEEEKPRRRDPPPPTPVTSDHLPPQIGLPVSFSRAPISQGPQPTSLISAPRYHFSERGSIHDSASGRHSLGNPPPHSTSHTNSPYQQLSGNLPDLRNPVSGRDSGLVASTPPPSGFRHSRTSSLSHGSANSQPPQVGGQVSHQPIPGGALHSNPFAQVQPSHQGGLAGHHIRQTPPPPALSRNDSHPSDHRFSTSLQGPDNRFGPPPSSDRPRGPIYDRYADDAALHAAQQRVGQRERDREIRDRETVRDRDPRGEEQHHPQQHYLRPQHPLHHPGMPPQPSLQQLRYSQPTPPQMGGPHQPPPMDLQQRFLGGPPASSRGPPPPQQQQQQQHQPPHLAHVGFALPSELRAAATPGSGGHPLQQGSSGMHEEERRRREGEGTDWRGRPRDGR